MATRMADSLALVRRCQAVGWDTEDTQRGVRITTPNGVFVVHRTYSDRNSIKNAEQNLKDLGLFDAEEAKKRTESIEAKRRIADGVKKMEFKTAALEKKAQAVNALKVAGGPYITDYETVGIAWFAKPHPAPWMRAVWMTPEIAKYLLDNHNEPGKPGHPGTNRPKSEAQIAHYASIILAGEWKFTHQGMAMDSNGMVQDAQHRLAAIEKAGEVLDDLKVPVVFWVGMDPDNFKSIDEGLLRNATQLLTRMGEKNGATLRAALRLILAFKTGDEDARGRARLKTTNASLFDTFGSNPDDMRTAATTASSHAKKVPMSQGAFCALYYLLRESNGSDNEYVDAFFLGIINGTTTEVDADGERVPTRLNLLPDDPREALRTTLNAIKERTGHAALGLDQLGLGITAWNYMVRGKHVRTYRWSKDTAIPQIDICKPGEGAVPRALQDEVDVV